MNSHRNVLLLSNIISYIIDKVSYIDKVSQVPLSRSRAAQKHESLDKTEHEELHSLTGQLNWVASQSRPDIAYDICELSTSLKPATVKNILDANKGVKKLKSDSLVLKFYSINEENVKIFVYSDSSFGNLLDGSSQGGYTILLADDKGHFLTLTWQSKKIRRIVRSTIAAETLALMDGADSALFLSALFCEIKHRSSKESLLPIDCIIDNYSLFKAIHSTKGIITEKSSRIDIGVIREMLKKSEISSVR